MRAKIESRFGFKEIAELRDNFEKRDWTNFDEFEFFFENFCSIYEHLNQEQTDLVLELTNDFLWLRENEYFPRLKNVLIKLSQKKHLNLDRVYVIPMVSPKDRATMKTKSSHHLAYLCRNNVLKHLKEFNKSIFIIVDDLTRLPTRKFLEKNNHPIIVVDDFIGTGDTATEALDEILALQNYSNKNLFVMSLVSQNRGKSSISKKGYELISDVIVSMGITDKYKGKEQAKNKKVMASIEDILAKDKKFDQGYRFGYKKSEALVSMIRTPNNTFPLYWRNCSFEKGKKWNAPFPR